MSERTALVTGGIGGIGSAICKDFLKNGYRVIANYHPLEEEQAGEWIERRKSDSEGEFYVEPADVASFESCVQMSDKIKKDIGNIDTLVNCAGIIRDKTLKGMTPDMWNDVIQVDLTGIYNITKQFIEEMGDAGFGRIVSISSVNGQKGQFGQTNYSAAKAGVHGFTMALAQELARKGVTVNSVSPGYIATPMTSSMTAEILEQIVAQIPVGRVGVPEDIAYAVAMLCDERASYITGANIPVNGCMFTSF